MRAFVCDACGTMYKPYGGLKTTDDNLRVYANGMTFVRIEKDGKMHGKGKIELCPECMEKVQNFIIDELCGDDSSFVRRTEEANERMKKVLGLAADPELDSSNDAAYTEAGVSDAI